MAITPSKLRRHEWECTSIDVGAHGPRQLEFHPTIPDTLLCGTIRGGVLILQNNQCVKRFHHGYGLHDGDATLGVCYFHNNPDLFIAASSLRVISCGTITADSAPAESEA